MKDAVKDKLAKKEKKLNKEEKQSKAKAEAADAARVVAESDLLQVVIEGDKGSEAEQRGKFGGWGAVKRVTDSSRVAKTAASFATGRKSEVSTQNTTRRS